MMEWFPRLDWTGQPLQLFPLVDIMGFEVQEFWYHELCLSHNLATIPDPPKIILNKKNKLQKNSIAYQIYKNN